ncbi:MAG: anti-sigma factor antagonist [Lachnospiraceae bacterium]|nr:anti-sigma factor antagonist [Lachnospiraceae bacterium]
MSVLRISLEGNIDASNVDNIKDYVEAEETREHSSVVIDCKNLNYISSVGLRVLLKLSKNEQKKGNEKIRVVDVRPEIYEIFETTGFTSIMEVGKTCKEIDPEGLTLMQEGYRSRLYRLDEDTLIKVYKGEDGLSLLMQAKKLAKIAFVEGVPTVLSYDIVKVGDDYGSIYECINSKSLSEYIIEDSGKIDLYLERYVNFMKQLFDIEIDDEEVPDLNKDFLDDLYSLSDILSVAQIGGIRRMIVWMPKTLKAGHKSLSLNNVILEDRELILTDMDMFGKGQPIFTFVGIYLQYKLLYEHDEEYMEKRYGISKELAGRIWEKTLSLYYKEADEAALLLYTEKIRLLADICFLNFLKRSDFSQGEFKLTDHDKVVRDIDRLLLKVEDLNLS